MGRRPSVTAMGNTLEMMTGTAFMKCTSRRWKGLVAAEVVASPTSRQLTGQLASVFGFFEFVHHVRRSGKALLGDLLELLLT